MIATRLVCGSCGRRHSKEIIQSLLYLASIYPGQDDVTFEVLCSDCAKKFGVVGQTIERTMDEDIISYNLKGSN